MVGLVDHPRLHGAPEKTWVLGTSPSMTVVVATRTLRERRLKIAQTGTDFIAGGSGTPSCQKKSRHPRGEPAFEV